MSSEVTLSTKNSGLDGADRVILSVTGITKFEVGMKIEVDYINPTDGWFVVWIMDNDDKVVLSFSAWIGKKIVNLNTREAGKWGSGESLSDYDFTPGAS